MSDSGAPIGILLAAGFSRRFGSNDKLLHMLPDGRPIALAAAQHLLQALPHSIAVIQPDNASLDRLLRDAGMQVLHCASAGMGDSIAAAVHASASFDPHSGYVIALADMPYLRPQTILKVAAALDNARIVAPAYQGQRGHPVGFSTSLREELLVLHGDEGARSVLQRHREELQLLDCDDAGVLADIDTAADLKPG
jgi:molybdenum cofactor cytidylyltransferase